MNDDVTQAMISVIPGQDGVREPADFTETRFYRYAMAYLMQDGNLSMPGGRYATDSAGCAAIAIAMVKVEQYHNGEAITYTMLDAAMGQVVNGSDEVASLLRESSHILREYGIDAGEQA